jgi:hypothetical protein
MHNNVFRIFIIAHEHHVLIVNDVFLTIFSGGVKVSDGMTMRQRVSL